MQSRRAKIEEISALLAAVPSGEVPVAVAFLSGELRQRQIGVGYAALGDLFPSAGPATSAPSPRPPAPSAAARLRPPGRADGMTSGPVRPRSQP